MVPAWVDLDEARDLVLAGRLHNPTTVAGCSRRRRPGTPAGRRCGRPTRRGRDGRPAAPEHGLTSHR